MTMIPKARESESPCRMPDGKLIRQVLLEAYDSGRGDSDEFTYVYDVASHLFHMQDSEGSWLQKYEYNGHSQVIR